MLTYPVSLTHTDDGHCHLSFLDFPEARVSGQDKTAALHAAGAVLEQALGDYFTRRQPIPLPSRRQRGQSCVALPALETAKVLLWNEMLTQKVRKADLARMLNVYTPQVDRLFDLDHSSKIEFVEQAARALGKTLVVNLQ